MVGVIFKAGKLRKPKPSFQAMNENSTARNSVGGSDEHQQLVNDFIYRLGNELHAEDGKLQSPQLAQLLTGIVTIVLPYNHSAIDALANGKEGVTDGKILLLNEEALVRRRQAFQDSRENHVRDRAAEDPQDWFQECLSDVAAAARGEPLKHLQSVSSERMVRLLNGVVQRSDWEPALGYDAARFEQKPVLNALKLIENDQRTPPSGNLGVGDFNAKAADVITALFSTYDPSVMDSAEQRAEIIERFSDATAGRGVHCAYLSLFTLVGMAEHVLGEFSKKGRANTQDASVFGTEVLEAHQKKEQVRDMIKTAFSGMASHASGFRNSSLIDYSPKKIEKPGL